jgi:hypothetical protein
MLFPDTFFTYEFIRFIKKNKEEVLYFLFSPNNLADKIHHFFLPVLIKNASIASNQNISI